MANAGRIVASRLDAPWLPAGGSAHVVLAANGAGVPAPTCMVRLLVTRGHDILTIVRGDGQGLDIPSGRVGKAGVPETLQTLMLDTLRVAEPMTLLGYVRNVVTEPTDDYPWPVPDAYFVVWHARVSEDAAGRGQWLPARAGPSELGTRHWWPLAAYILGDAP